MKMFGFGYGYGV